MSHTIWQTSLPVESIPEREYFVTPRRSRRRKRRKLSLLLAILLFLCGFLLGRRATAEEPAAAPLETAIALEKPVPGGADSGNAWALRLVNWEHPLSEDDDAPTLTALKNGHHFDSRAYPALQAMMDGARAAGLHPLICSSYRTRDKQRELYERKVQTYLDQGEHREAAEAHAAQWVAYPGTSEHETGLAVDIVDEGYQLLDEAQENTAVQQWLMAHCAEYGFILRYPTDKSALTGVNYEPWHYRYVGTEAAETIMKMGLCLEEYFQSLPE